MVRVTPTQMSRATRGDLTARLLRQYELVDDIYRQLDAAKEALRTGYEDRQQLSLETALHRAGYVIASASEEFVVIRKGG